jgi:hypothetical protein
MKLTDIAEQANENGIDEVVIPNYNKIKELSSEFIDGEYCVIQTTVVHRSTTNIDNFIVLTQEGLSYNSTENYEWEDVVAKEYFSQEELLAAIADNIPSDVIVSILKQRTEVYNAIIWEAIFNG